MVAPDGRLPSNLASALRSEAVFVAFLKLVVILVESRVLLCQVQGRSVVWERVEVVVRGAVTAYSPLAPDDDVALLVMGEHCFGFEVLEAPDVVCAQAA